MSLPPWSIAVTQWLLIPVITGLAAGFTPASSGFRTTAVTVVVALACSFQFSLSRSITDIRVSGPLAGVCWANVFNATDVLLLSRINYQAQAEWEQDHRNAVKDGMGARSYSLSNKLKWSLALPFNYRRIGTPWQIHCLPIFDNPDEKCVPSRSSFLLQAATKLSLSVFLLILSLAEPDAPGVGKMVLEISSGRPVLVPKPEDITLRVVLAQTSFVLAFGMMVRFAINAVYYSLAIVSVGLCFSEPTSWPPISEPITQASSIRRFWGHAWHQCYREGLYSNARFITTALGIQLDALWTCHVRAVLAFLISGFLHLMMDHGFGIPLDRSGAMWFFGLQAAGMIVENTAQGLFHEKNGKGGAVWKRLIGYIWVIAFFTWSGRFWVNPMVWKLYQAGVALPTPFLFPGSYRLLIEGTAGA